MQSSRELTQTTSISREAATDISLDLHTADVPYIPATYEEYLKWKGLETWPEPILSEKPFDFQVDDIFGTEEDILAELSTIDTKSLFNELETFESKLREFEKRLQPLASGTYADDALQLGERKSVHKPTHTEKLVAKYRSQLEKRRAKGQSLLPNFLKQLNEIEKQDAALRKYLLEQSTVPEFSKSEFCDLPGHYDAPYLLQVIGNAQTFRDTAFLKIWRKVIISEAAIGVLQDLFWWVFIDRFVSIVHADQESKLRMIRDKSLFFDRLSDSFVALFDSINPETRDDVLKVYPDFMAQSLYVSFFEAFPDSARFAFRDDFKQYLHDVCFEMFCGLHAPTNGYGKWPLEVIFARLKVKSSLGQSDMRPDASELSNYLQRELQPAPLANDWEAMTARVQTSRRASKKQQDSHPIGAAERFRNILFNTNGRSPLMERYIQMHNDLANENDSADQTRMTTTTTTNQKDTQPKLIGSLQVRHPRIDRPADSMALTYRDVIRASQADFKTAKQSHQKARAALESDLKIVEELRREALERIKNLEVELYEKRHNPSAIREVRLRSELFIAKEPKMDEQLEERKLLEAAKNASAPKPTDADESD